MRNFLDEIEKRVLIYDGSKGYMLQKLGMKGGECGELWNVEKSDAVKEVYRSYKDAGSDVIQTNTFTGSRVHLEKYSLGDRTYELNFHGARLAREVAGEDIFVAASIGPTGLMFEPYGDLTFEMAYDVFKEQVKAVVDGGVDIINFETFTDLAEIRAALLAAKETAKLPVICSMAYENNGRTLMGTEPFIAVKTLLALGADMVGVNCSFGAEHMLGIVKSMYEAGGGRLSVKPNAGMPELADDKVCYRQSAEDFAAIASRFIEYGAALIGGCCGTTPDFIKAVKEKLGSMRPVSLDKGDEELITSSSRYSKLSGLNASNIGKLDFSHEGISFERILKDDYSEIEDKVQEISAEGYDAVIVVTNVVDGNRAFLGKVIDVAQTYIKAPLIIETTDMAGLEGALRIYNGIAGVVLQKGNEEQKKKLHEMAAKYGCKIISDRIIQ